MGVMHRIKVILGLADDYDEYDDEYDEYDDDTRVVRDAPDVVSPYAGEPASVRRVSREPDVVRAREATPMVRSTPTTSYASEAPAPAPQVRIHTVEPHSFAEAQSLADKFRGGQPVILNLTMTEAEVAKRLLDFASGLTYGLNGGLQKVSDKVFMLTPVNVDLSSSADRVRPRESSPFAAE